MGVLFSYLSLGEVFCFFHFIFHVRALLLTLDSEFLCCHLNEDMHCSGKEKGCMNKAATLIRFLVVSQPVVVGI